jgi:uncharacterized protein YjiS (DUF1127 family)
MDQDQVLHEHVFGQRQSLDDIRNLAWLVHEMLDERSDAVRLIAEKLDAAETLADAGITEAELEKLAEGRFQVETPEKTLYYEELVDLLLR